MKKTYGDFPLRRGLRKLIQNEKHYQKGIKIKMSNKTLIYVVKSFKSKRHLNSESDMYFIEPHHTIWGLNDEKMRVEVVYVSIGSENHLSAQRNSKKQDEDKKAKKLEEFNKECCVCLTEKTKEAIKCKQCNHKLCYGCCCEYILANLGKFRSKSDETGYADCTFVPCPICRTENEFWN